MIRYKLARIVDGRYLSANHREDVPFKDICLKYIVGQITSVKNKTGIACYKKKSNALTTGNIEETRDWFNNGKPIALLKLRSIGKATSFSRTNPYYQEGRDYEGGINYQSVLVLEATEIKE